MDKLLEIINKVDIKYWAIIAGALLVLVIILVICLATRKKGPRVVKKIKLKEDAEGCFVIKKTSDFMHTFEICDERVRTIVSSCLKFKDEDTVVSAIDCVKHYLKFSAIEDRTSTLNLLQPFPKFVIRQEQEGYFVTLFLASDVAILEKRAIRSYKETLEFIELLKKLITSEKILVSNQEVEGMNLIPFEGNAPVQVYQPVIGNEVKQVKAVEPVKPVEQVKPVKVEEPKPVVEEKVEPAKDTVTPVEDVESFSKSFEAKLYLNSDEYKQIYSEMKNEILSYKGIYSKISFKHETFKYDGKLVMKFNIRGTKPMILCALDQSDVENSEIASIKIDGFKPNEDTPLFYKVYNNLRIKYGKQIIACCMKKFGIEKDPEYQAQDFASKYNGKSLEELLEEGEIRRQ